MGKKRTPSNEKKKKSILVPVDFSDDSREALVYAANIANCMDAELTVLHVIHDPDENPGFYHRKRLKSMVPMEKIADKMMNEFLEKSGREDKTLNLPERVRPLLVTGLPEVQIPHVAVNLDAELVVMSSRGLSKISRFLLGSVAERIVRISPVPVLVYKSKKTRKTLAKGLV